MTILAEKICSSSRCTTTPAMWYNRKSGDWACKECALELNKKMPVYENGLPVCVPAISGYNYLPDGATEDKTKPETNMRHVSRIVSLTAAEWMIYYHPINKKQPEKYCTAGDFHRWVEGKKVSM